MGERSYNGSDRTSKKDPNILNFDIKQNKHTFNTMRGSQEWQKHYFLEQTDIIINVLFF